MKRTLLTSTVGLACLALPLAALQSADEAKPATTSPAAIQFFESKVRPVLVEHCYKCHGDAKHKGGLRLDSHAAMMTGGDTGPAIEPGNPEKSLLVKAINYGDEHMKMPPAKKLPKEQIDNITAWVKMGAPWPGAGETVKPPRKTEKEITDKDRAHWAFQPVKRPAPPVAGVSRAPNPIDAFILARLEAKGLHPNPPASKRELIRRVYYDLTGLPPTPDEVETLVNDKSEQWYESLVDRLLDSPRYGEKWGRHWLDLVHFAETNSYERDNPKPNAWRYRDYVIRSFNQDKPYDQFIREQLAGDEMTPEGAASPSPDAVIATGYLRLGIWDDEPSDRELARYDMLDDIVATTGQVFLGMTLDCARCHDHKIDPILQKDYYRFLSFFQNINHYRNGGPTDEAPIYTDPAGKAAYEAKVKALEERREGLRKAVAAFEDEFRKLYAQVNNGKEIGPVETPKMIATDAGKLLGKERTAHYEQQRKELLSLKNQKVAGEMALCVTEAGRSAPETCVLIRGNPHVKGDKVAPAFPTVFNLPAPMIPPPSANAKTTGRRTVLANWIASKDNPLTARVMVNRIWQYHFGRGIVRSSSNFGTAGDRPTHPELLDWLAAEFAEKKFQMKPMHRLMVTSNAYKMSSRNNPQAAAVDPANDLLWRYDMRRLTGEEIRDSILSVCGCLNLKMEGPSIYVDIPKEVMAGQSAPGYGWGKSPEAEQNRRSIYIHVKRSLLTPILESFDLGDVDRSNPVRFVTTQPGQALGMINGEFVNKEAGLLAARLRKESPNDVAKQVRQGLSLVTQRPPTDAEVKRGVDLIAALQAKEGATAEAALKFFCLMAVNMNEFVYLD
jgi:mono/diheme cytochrome c family protein